MSWSCKGRQYSLSYRSSAVMSRSRLGRVFLGFVAPRLVLGCGSGVAAGQEFSSFIEREEENYCASNTQCGPLIVFFCCNRYAREGHAPCRLLATV
jgi:hypothetical protein